MPLGYIPTLNTVIQFSGNQTNQELQFRRALSETFLEFYDTTESKVALKMWLDNLGAVPRISWDFEHYLLINLLQSAAPDNRAFTIVNEAAAVLLQLTHDYAIFGKTLRAVGGTSPSLGTASWPFNHLFMTGDIDIGGGTKDTQLKDSGSGFTITHGSGPDQSLGFGCCSGGGYYIDIDDGGGRVDMQGESFVMNDGAFDPTQDFLQVLGIARTSGHVAVIVGDKAILTTGDLFRVYNDGAGTGTDYVLGIDKNGVLRIGNPTGAKFGKIERTATHFILDSLSEDIDIKKAGASAVKSNASALELGNTTLAPKLPVLTTAQRDALAATQGMIIYHVGPPLAAQIYTGAAWANL